MGWGVQVWRRARKAGSCRKVPFALSVRVTTSSYTSAPHFSRGLHTRSGLQSWKAPGAPPILVLGLPKNHGLLKTLVLPKIVT